MKPIGNRRELPGNRVGIRILGLAAVMGLLSLGQAMRADDAAAGARAARLSSVDGKVQLTQGNTVLAEQAVVNTPIFEGTRIVTSDDGRAELQFDDGSVARISPNSLLRIAKLHGPGASGESEVVLEGGLGYFELQNGTTSVRFSDSAVTGSGFTVLRIDLDNAPGDIAVFSGNAHIVRGNDLTLDLHGGESVALNANDASQYQVAESIEPDSWDAWNSDRDQVLNADAAARTGTTSSYVNNQNPAWNDLDANGAWYSVPGQGNIWSPYAAANAGFDPYGNGNWVFSPGYGYMWASAYPWGFMPFQCGMWNYYNGFGWGWAPGMGFGMGPDMGIGLGMGMGGCSPWYGGGGLFVPNIGNGFGGYRPPMPPRISQGPIPRSGLGGLGKAASYSVVAVNRRPSGASAALPARDGTTPVTIEGHTVLAARALSPRPSYSATAGASGALNRATAASVGARTAVRASGANPVATRPSYSAMPQARSGQNSSASSHSSSVYSGPAPSASPSAGGGFSAPAGSGGGGGMRGGGGGGAGGASHH